MKVEVPVCPPNAQKQNLALAIKAEKYYSSFVLCVCAKESTVLQKLKRARNVKCNHIRKKSTFLICRMSLVSPDLPKMSLSLLVSIGESSTSN